MFKKKKKSGGFVWESLGDENYASAVFWFDADIQKITERAQPHQKCPYPQQ